MFSTLVRSCRLLSTRSVVRNCRYFSSVSKSSPGLALEYRDDVAVITMNNGENRINDDFLQEYFTLLDTVESTPESRALVTTGLGKFYSLGLDLDWAIHQREHVIVDFLRALNRFIHRLNYFPIPTLAAINGHAFAGGFVLAASHDLRTMNSEKGWMCLNEVLLDIPIAQFGIQVIKDRLQSGQVATDMLLLGKKFNGQDALDSRIVHASYPGATLLDGSVNFLNTQVDKKGIPRQSLLHMKKSVFKEALQEFVDLEGSDFENSDYVQSVLRSMNRMKKQ